MPILNQDMGNPNLQKLIRNMTIHILSWTAQNNREEPIGNMANDTGVIQDKVYRIKREIPSNTE